MKRLRILSLICVSVWLCLLCGCGKTPVQKPFGFQLEMPEVGEEIAIMHTNKGDIYLRFFPEEAPKAVEHFKTLAKEGYYDGVIFHRIVADYIIQSGDPTGTGNGGAVVGDKYLEDEFHPSLGNLRGALSMANRGENTNASQFFINQATSAGSSSIGMMHAMYNTDENNDPDAFNEYYRQYASSGYGLKPDALTDEIIQTYEKVGGNIYLDGPLRTSGGHTVFGQVFKGMDVVDDIAYVETNENDFPLELVMIESIEWTTYQGESEITTTGQ